MLNDVRHALQFLGRSPGFSLTAVITLALGIGAITGVYSIYSAVFLKPLPFDHPERVVAIWVRDATGGLDGIAGGTLNESVLFRQLSTPPSWSVLRTRFAAAPTTRTKREHFGVPALERRSSVSASRSGPS
jgi:hypothetical protein